MYKEKLDKVYNFLLENREYNKNFQEKYYKDILFSKKTKAEKIIGLLHHVVHTQSQPKIDKISSFFKEINNKIDENSSFKNFIDLLRASNDLLKDKNDSIKYNYGSLFNSLRGNHGWGDKTSALFVKAIYHIHNCNYDPKLKIWDDIPKRIENDDKLYLPVDAVILHIFQELKIEKTNSFNSINNILRNNYKGESIEAWDDLWFWGFITQKTNNKGVRELGWNQGKYWILLHTDKSQIIIDEIMNKAKCFMDIIRS